MCKQNRFLFVPKNVFEFVMPDGICITINHQPTTHLPSPLNRQMSNHRCHAIKPVFELEEVHSGAQLEVDVEDRIVRSIVLSLKDDTMLDATVKEVLHGCVTSPATHERKQVREHQLLVGFHKRGAVMKPYKAIKTMIESKAAPHSVIMAEHMEPHHIAETKAQYEVLRNQMNKSAAPAPSNTSTKSLKPMSELIEEAAEAGMPATEGRATLAKLPYRTDWTGYIFKGGVAAFGDSMDAELQFPLSPNEIYGRDIVNAMMLCDEVQDAAVVCRTLSGTRSFLIFVEINRKPTMAHYKELARAIQDALTQQSCEAWYACVHGYSTEPFDFTVYYGQWDSGKL